jgi:hypothetical protein
MKISGTILGKPVHAVAAAALYMGALASGGIAQAMPYVPEATSVPAVKTLESFDRIPYAGPETHQTKPTKSFSAATKGIARSAQGPAPVVTINYKLNGLSKS